MPCEKHGRYKFNLHGAIFGLKKVATIGYAHLPLLSLPITSSITTCKAISKALAGGFVYWAGALRQKL